MGEELPSFSVARLRRRATEHRRLDYNAPLLSVRRAVADAGGGGGSLWKLSSELTSEPIRATCAVPFEWELHPGRPKQPPPTSPSTPSTATFPRWPTLSDATPPPPTVSRAFQSVSSFSSSPPPSSSSSSSSSSSPSSSASLHSSVLHRHTSLPGACPSSSHPFHVPSPPNLQQQDHLLLELLEQPHLDERRLVHKPNDDGFPAEKKEVEDENRKKTEGVSINSLLCIEEGQNESFSIHTSYQAAVAKPWNHRAAVGSPSGGDSGQLALANTHANFSSMAQDPSAGSYRRTTRKVGYFNPLRFLSLGLRTAFAQACRKALASVGSLTRITCEVAPSRPVNAVVHRDDSSSGSDEEEFVVREVKAVLQSKRNQKFKRTPICPGSPRNINCTDCSLRYVTNTGNFCRYDSSLKASPLHDQARKGLIASPVHDQAETEGDEPQFYDAPSRFGSQTSTPGRVTFHGNGSGAPMPPFDEVRVNSGLPKDSISDGTIFGDGASNHFETPRASVSDVCKSAAGDSCLKRDGWRSYTSMDSKSPSCLSQRVGKALRLETRETQAGMTETKGAGRHFSGEQCLLTDSSLGKPPEQLLKLRNGSCTRLRRYRSLESSTHKDSLNPGSTSPIFPAKCSSHRYGRSEGVSAADEIGWPLGLSSYCSDAQLRSPGIRQKDSRDNIPGLIVPSPPLPPSPSGLSWLQKVLSSRAFKLPPLAAVRIAKAGSIKNELKFLQSKAEEATAL